MRSAAKRLLLDRDTWSPYRLANNAAVYSLEGSPSDSTYQIDGSNRLMLVADRSGNSAVNGLVLPGTGANHATAPDSSPLRVTGDIDVRIDLACTDWTPSAENSIIAKYDYVPSKRCYGLFLDPSGKLIFTTSSDGTSSAGKLASATSTIAVPVADFGRIGIRATRDVDNGAGGNTTRFYTSTDFQNWTLLGDPVTLAFTTSIFASDPILVIGALISSGTTQEQVSGIIYRAQIRNNILDDGTGIVFDANFSTAAKLATTFTESSSNAATVTINTTAIALPARICGARDLTQAVQANQPIFSVSNGYNIATFDGTNDYLKSAPFTTAQSFTDYLVASPVSWTDGDRIIDANTNDGGGTIWQSTTTPGVVWYSGTTPTPVNDWPVGTRAAIAALYSGASSAFMVNQGTPSVQNVGTGSTSGLTIGARADGAQASNITFSEFIRRAAGDDLGLRQRINRANARKWGVS